MSTVLTSGLTSVDVRTDNPSQQIPDVGLCEIVFPDSVYPNASTWAIRRRVKEVRTRLTS